MVPTPSLLDCLVRALCEKARPALTGAAPFAAALEEAVPDALGRALERLAPAEIRAELQGFATGDPAECAEVVRRTVAPVAGRDAPLETALRTYFAYWPSAIRHGVRRPSDPGGRAVPAGLGFDDPADLLRLLPLRPPRLRAGQVAGGEAWELVRYCGLGERTEVWAGRPPFGGEAAALKFVMDPAAGQLVLDNEPLFTKAFELTGLSGVVPLRTVYPDPKRVYLEYGYAPGYDLSGVMLDWKLRWGQPMPDQAASLARRLAEVVGKAHARAFVHRGLKPSNAIMIPTDEGRVTLWVTDFGWGQLAARLAREHPAAGRQAAVRGARTAAYLAPQVLADEPPDPRDDVYAIGVIWYQLLCQDPVAVPTAGGWAPALAAQGVPQEHIDLLAECVAAEASARPADAAALARRFVDLTALPVVTARPGRAGGSLTGTFARPSVAGPVSGAFLRPSVNATGPVSGALPHPNAGSRSGALPRPAAAGSGTLPRPPAPGAAGASSGGTQTRQTTGPASGATPRPGGPAAGPVSGAIPRPGAPGGQYAFDPRQGGGAAVPGPVTTTLPEREMFGPRRKGLTMNSLGMTFATVPAGSFMMGAEPDAEHNFVGDELPQHPVRISRPFMLSIFPVTQDDFRRVMGRNPSYFNEQRKGNGAHPVESVTWFEAEQFCAKLGALPEEVTAGRRYMLPTEAEWEYACRAGTTTAFWCGAKLNPAAANYAAGADKDRIAAAGGTTLPVGSFRPNPWGLFDMHGNVAEWVGDWYSDRYYAESPTDDPTGPNSGSAKVTRGGCWQSLWSECRSSARAAYQPERGTNRIGFRVIMVVAAG